MKAMNFPMEAPGSFGAWIARSPKSVAPTRSNGKDQLSLMERFDRWLWKQHVRDREAYLADAQDIFDLEERIRRLERSVGSCYY
jgi:hypothetical protein